MSGSTILRVDSSITGVNSVSRQITSRIVEQQLAARPGDTVVERDLVADPLAHLTLDQFADQSVLDEFLAADTVVVGAPMYNFTLPSQLKAWIDRLAVNGRTFRYTAEGKPEGLAGPKRVIIALSRGGFYGAEQGNADFEHLESYLKVIFGFIGIVPEFVRADGINLGPEVKAKSVEQALREVDLLAA
nr:NAD(P)H-dependent oxidoreductase [uncultured Sphingomonas sp.]